MVHPNATCIRAFYEAFGRRDAVAMAALYASDTTFSDPAFPDLSGAAVPGMWASLCEGAEDLRIELKAVEADDGAGTATWEAWYTFGAARRPVHNVIRATFTFRDGFVIAHEDRFDFWRWSRQALGLAGWMLGWSGLFQRQVQRVARKGLMRWLERPPAGRSEGR